MQMTLHDLMDNGLLTPDEATELQAYLTSDPETFYQATQALRDKAWQGLALLEAETDGPMH